MLVCSHCCADSYPAYTFDWEGIGMCNQVVLVVDDAADIRKVVARLLAQEGYRVIEAGNGPLAVELARRHCPTLLVMDINLPGIDGLEVARQIRADPALEDVPIIAMTAYVAASTTAMAHRAGIQHVISKPFDIQTMMQAVLAFLPAVALA